MSFLPYGGSSLGGWLVATGSSVLAHGAAVYLALGGIDAFFQQIETAQPRPQFTITLEQLDSDALAGIIERDGVAGGLDQAEPSQAETPTPESADTVEPEQLAALTPQEAPEPEPEIEAEEPPLPEPETVTPEEPAQAPELAEPDMPEPVTPQAAPSAMPVTPQDMAALTPITPETGAAAGMAPQPVDPSPLIPETVAPVGPAASGSGLTGQAPAAQTVQPVGPANDILTPDAPIASGQSQVVTALNRRPDPGPGPATPRPAAQPPAPPSAQDLAIGDLIRRIRAADADPCLLALPRRAGQDGVGLALIAAADGAMSNFANTVLTPEDADIRQTRTLVDPRQCPALSYVRQNRDYPATRLGLALDTAEVPSGGNLTGVLRGTAGRYVTLLLIDNNGVVQDLQRFMSFSGNFARFDVPVTRQGPPRDTSQILLAIATQRPASTIRDRDGRLAQDVFAGLSGELASSAAIALTTFDVR